MSIPIKLITKKEWIQIPRNQWLKTENKTIDDDDDDHDDDDGGGEGW